jgi:hypothetical protein
MQTQISCNEAWHEEIEMAVLQLRSQLRRLCTEPFVDNFQSSDHYETTLEQRRSLPMHALEGAFLRSSQRGLARVQIWKDVAEAIHDHSGAACHPGFWPQSDTPATPSIVLR